MIIEKDKTRHTYIRKFLRITELQGDPTYQRPLEERRVKKIAEEFDPDLVRDVYVSTRVDGRNYIMDGQHTTAAAGLVGWKEVDCRVYTGLSSQEEAQFFGKLNRNIKKVPAIDQFKASKVAGDELAILLDRILDDYHLKVANRGKDAEVREGYTNIQPVTQLLKMLERRGEEHTRLLMRLLIEGWGYDALSFNNNVLLGMSKFLETFTTKDNPYELDFDRMASIMRSIPASGIITAAEKLKRGQRVDPSAIAQALDKKYRVPGAPLSYPSLDKRYRLS